MKKLHRGRYYWHKDSSRKKMHPSYIYKKNDKKNKYNIVCFTSQDGRGRSKLNKNINPRSDEPCYVWRTPRTSKRQAFGKELNGFKVTDKQDKALITYIKRKK